MRSILLPNSSEKVQGITLLITDAYPNSFVYIYHVLASMDLEWVAQHNPSIVDTPSNFSSWSFSSSTASASQTLKRLTVFTPEWKIWQGIQSISWTCSNAREMSIMLKVIGIIAMWSIHRWGYLSRRDSRRYLLGLPDMLDRKRSSRMPIFP